MSAAIKKLKTTIENAGAILVGAGSGFSTAATFPDEIHAQRRLLRSLMNLRHPGPISSDFLREQDILLQDEAANKGVVKPDELPTIADETSKDITPQDAPARNLILWHGDINRLAADAIVNAANSAMLGCFAPCHGCIDNAIHSAAGLQLREACAQLMEQQGHPEPTGQAQITPTYNLPSKFVLHTVGPIIPAGLWIRLLLLRKFPLE